MRKISVRYLNYSVLLWCLVAAAAPTHAQDRSSAVVVPTPGGTAVSPDTAIHRAFYQEWHFAPARVEGDLVYLSGTVAVPSRADTLPLDSARQEASYRRAWQRIRRTLEAAGSSTADIVEMTTFHLFDSTVVRGTKQQQIDAFRRVKDEFVPAPYPAWTGIGVATLYPDRALVEIRVIARIPQVATKAPLSFQEIGADSTAFDVIATLIIGSRNVILWDAQYHAADARRVADAIQATGKHLQAIVISHPDEDHYTGAAVIVERFPGTPVYMTPAAIRKYNDFAPRAFKAERPGTVPDSLVTPQPLPSNVIFLDGERLEVIPDLTGDNPGFNSALWIPSVKTILAGDLVFNGVHPWLGASDSASMVAWRASLDRVAALHPTVVIAGHKKDIAATDSPALLEDMKQYLITFDSLRQASTTPAQLRDAMLARYPGLAVRKLLGSAAVAAYHKKPG